MASSKKMPDDESLRIGVVGAGSWGTALANLLALKRFAVDLWVYEKEVLDQIKSVKENRVFLPGVILSEDIKPSSDIGGVVKDKDLVLIVVPSHFMRDIAGRIAAYISDETKGILKIDIKKPEEPKLVASFDTPGESASVVVYGEYVIVPDSFSLIVLK